MKACRLRCVAGCAPCVNAQTVMNTNKTEIKNIAPPPIIERTSSESRNRFSKIIKNKMIAKVSIPKVKVDIRCPKLSLPKMIQDRETITELDTSTR